MAALVLGGTLALFFVFFWVFFFLVSLRGSESFDTIDDERMFGWIGERGVGWSGLELYI